ncbi:MAG: hypothetical protein ABIJ45_01540 [Candidatus Zixiibacteriota bacterium]
MRNFIILLLALMIMSIHGVIGLAGEYSKITLTEAGGGNRFSCNLIIPNPMDYGNGIYTRFTIPESCQVTISILDTLLNDIYLFDQEKLGPGEYIVNWDYNDKNSNDYKGLFCYLELTAESCSTQNKNRYYSRFRFVRFK